MSFKRTLEEDAFCRSSLSLLGDLTAKNLDPMLPGTSCDQPCIPDNYITLPFNYGDKDQQKEQSHIYNNINRMRHI